MNQKLRYPSLSAFLGGWFHQDFDIEGATAADVVATYRKTSSEAERQAIRHDIDDFLADNPGPADRAFHETFKPDIDPSGFSQNAREWLSSIRALLG